MASQCSQSGWEEDSSQSTPTLSRSPLRLSDTSALALRMSRRLESEQSASQQSDAETAVAGASVGDEVASSGSDSECCDGIEGRRGSMLQQGVGVVGTEASLSVGVDEAAADSWLLEILDMQARMHGWFDTIRSAVLPPREAARLEELRAGCARAPSHTRPSASSSSFPLPSRESAASNPPPC